MSCRAEPRHLVLQDLSTTVEMTLSIIGLPCSVPLRLPNLAIRRPVEGATDRVVRRLSVRVEGSIVLSGGAQ